jgi:hypothetical protein
MPSPEEAARANLGITRSNQFPQVSASGDIQFTRLSRDGSFALPSSFVPSQNRNWGEASLNLLSFEVDLWGRLRRATEAARANLLSAEENRKAVVTTLVSDVATQYFTLRELDYELEISRHTLATRRDSLQLTQIRQGGGIATQLDLRQAEQLVDTAAETIPTLQQQIEQTENQITLLLGENPGDVMHKTRMVDLRKEKASLDFLGYTFRWDRDLYVSGKRYLNVEPSKKSLQRERERINELTDRRQGCTPIPRLIERLNRQLTGWATYFSWDTRAKRTARSTGISAIGWRAT